MSKLVDIKSGIFDSSCLKDYLRCPRYFYLRWILGLESRGVNVATGFGEAFHAGKAAWYQTGKDDLVGLKAFIESWDKLGIVGDAKRNAEIGVLLLKQYFNTYRNDGKKYLPEYIECQFAIDMPNGTVLAGRIDAVEENNGLVDVTDTKTTSMQLTEYFWKDYINDFQMSTYLYAVKQLLGRSDSITIDAVSIRGNFERRTNFRSDLQEADWLNTYIKITSQIKAKLKMVEEQLAPEFFQNQTSCGDFGKCKYLPICQYGLEHPATSVDFETGHAIREG